MEIDLDMRYNNPTKSGLPGDVWVGTGADRRRTGILLGTGVIYAIIFLNHYKDEIILEKTAVHWRYNKDAKRYTIRCPNPQMSQSQMSQSQMPGSQAPIPATIPSPGTMKVSPQRKWHHVTLEHPASSCAGDRRIPIIWVNLPPSVQ